MNVTSGYPARPLIAAAIICPVPKFCAHVHKIWALEMILLLLSVVVPPFTTGR
jgi:hypothetical protein